MCAVIPNNLLFLLAAIALTVSTFFEGNMTSEALPLMKNDDNQRFSVDQGPLHGSDFLSIFLDSPSPLSPETTTSTDSTTEFPNFSLTTTIPRSYSYNIRKFKPTVGNLFEINRKNNKITNDDDKLSDGVVLAVRVSSSVAKTVSNDNGQNKEEDKNDIETNPGLQDEQLSSVSEEHPDTLIAEASKNEFNVEEKEPSITYHGYHTDPSPSESHHHHVQSSYSPYRETVIFHNTQNQAPAHAHAHARAQSISYSSIIQNVPNSSTNERQERHYETKNNFNNFKGEITTPSTFFNEKTWESPGKIYKYGGEENYEVDENDSVVSNGRVHGVQKHQPKRLHKGAGAVTDDHQKVGYVVEGRNYRKYRVEERTSDGFIVGEYGVVSHDDGSLRGVRYTADGTINPRLIYDALMKFLSL